MPVDRLKIDQSFVRDIPRNLDDCAIVRAILAMAANLNLEVIAEGVESEAQAAFLRAEGCHEIQGYLLSPPMSADSFLERYLAAERMTVRSA
jgi:EAL domain-containing protein (putative c-di-GMP-specific phosphodiesterase class I)